MLILDKRQIAQRTRRMAYEILERNYGASEIILAGLNNNGLAFAQLLLDELAVLRAEDQQLILTRIRLNPANPLEYAPYIEMEADAIAGKPVIIVDDVANTGRTIFFAIQPLLGVLPQKVEVAVLVDRKHKSFPIKADYVGLSLATTLRDDIRVRLDDEVREARLS
ncbi:MAG: phosphoribosyltransferase family protein [Saprospiraceae bacterium]